MKLKMLLIGSGLIIWVAGCSSAPFFPTNASQILQSEAEFGVLKAEPDVHQGRIVKLAARMVNAKPLNQGTLVLAEWLPYPQVEYEGPDDTGWVSKGVISVFYPDTLDAEGSLPGNKFLVIGEVVRDTHTALSLSQITARCLYVWKTGNADLGEPDDEYDALEEMYCAEDASNLK